jgi:hypothetical protein
MSREGDQGSWWQDPRKVNPREVPPQSSILAGTVSGGFVVGDEAQELALAPPCGLPYLVSFNRLVGRVGV